MATRKTYANSALSAKATKNEFTSEKDVAAEATALLSDTSTGVVRGVVGPSPSWP